MSTSTPTTSTVAQAGAVPAPQVETIPDDTPPSAEDVRAYFSRVLGAGFLDDWQVAQVVDAVRILYEDVVHVHWATEFPWKEWKQPHLHFPRLLERYRPGHAASHAVVPPRPAADAPKMLEWLERWLSEFPGSMIIVSHDRTFLDHTVTRVFDLDSTRHTLEQYIGNYSGYLEQFLQASQWQMHPYRDQVYEIRRMRQDIARTKQQALRVELTTTSREPSPRRYAKKVARKAKARQKKLERYLDSDDRLEKPKQSWQIKLEFAHPPDQSQNVLILQDLAIGYNPLYPLVEKVNLHIHAGQRVVLTRPNGRGKTTLLRTIAGQLPPLSGYICLGTNHTVGYMAQEQEILDLQLTPLESIQKLSNLNETEARTLLHLFLFSGDYALHPARELSYGERSRLALATLVVGGCNFLLLDEPINHLDIPSRTNFETALSMYEDAISGATSSPTLDEWYRKYGAGLCRQASKRLGINE